jgi:hypothetical protein
MTKHAFPTRTDSGYDLNGMSLRDYFAAAALKGMVHLAIHESQEAMAEECYEIADAMLAERAKEAK